MFRIYRDLLAAFWGGFALFSVLLLVINLYLLSDAALVSSIVLFAVAVFALAIVLHLKADKRLRQLEEQLLEQCRVREYISAYEALLQRPCAKDATIAKALYTNLAIGYSLLGDDMRTFQLMQYAVPPAGNSVTVRRQQVVYCNNMAHYYVAAGDADNAAKAAADLRQLLTTFKRTDPIQMLQYNLMLTELDIRLLRGHAQGVKTALEIALQGATRPYNQVSLHRSLATACRLEGNTAEAVQHLQSILQVGGDSRHVAWAREQLMTIQAE